MDKASTIPLAERMRPERLEDIIGQEHLTGERGILTQMIAAKQLRSAILYGTPGTGKTSMARCIAKQMNLPFEALSALEAGVKEIRATMDRARMFGAVLVFIDEIHRLNKSQQDVLLSGVESGAIVLIGATTEHPGVAINRALLSRCEVLELRVLERESLIALGEKAIAQDEVVGEALKGLQAWDALVDYGAGDARKFLNGLEKVARQAGSKGGVAMPIAEMDNTAIQEILHYGGNNKAVGVDANFYYNHLSAMIKSIRGGDPNASLYYLAQLLTNGEEPMTVARRLVISASEDIGLANPNALLLATAAMTATQSTGMPEARIILAEAVIYLATSPKSNSSYVAINKAFELAKQHRVAPPDILHGLASPATMVNKSEKGKYLYPHDHPANFVEQEYLPASLKGTVLWEPAENGKEKEISQRLAGWWKGKYGYK